MGLNITGLNELCERLERLRADEVMARALAEQAARMAARVREGLSEPPDTGGHNEPWLQSGALRNSVGAQADGLQAAVGSSDPAAVPQEMGTAHMPPRPFLAPVAAGMGGEVGAAVAAALRGESPDGFDPGGVQLASSSGEHPEDPDDGPAKKDLGPSGQAHTHTPQIIPGLNSPFPTIPPVLFGGGRGPMPAGPRPAAPSGQQRSVETGASQAAGRAKLEVGAEQVTLNQERFADLAAQRAARGLPVAGSAEDKATLARLDVNGKTYYGANGKAQDPRTPITLDRVNPQTRTHAEAEVVQKALNDGGKANGGRAEMWVDRPACDSCGLYGGLRSLARNLGVDELIVHGPDGAYRYTPTK